jgi:murein DD-endopeptidase MepM/ murein hydrolase activator NlpD
MHDGSLYGMMLHTAPGERVDVALTDGDYTARVIELPLIGSMQAARGVIETSLYQAAIDAGVPPSVLQDMIRAYSFDVDFQREIQQGDSFALLYEEFLDEDGNAVRYGAPTYAVLNVSGATLPIYRYTPASGFADYFNDKGESVRKALLRTPVDGARITSGFGMRDHPLLGYSRMHKGVDFGAVAGTPIMAAGDGVIDFIGRNNGYGNYIRIRHNGTYSTAYAHMQGFASGLGQGSHVRQGQVIGYVGTTGMSTGPHLHYEVLVNNEQINPLDVKLPSGEKLAGTELAAFLAVRDTLDQQYAELLSEKYVAGSQ